MKKLLALVVLFLPLVTLSKTSSKSSSFELYITFSANDCINCTVALNQLHLLPPSLKKYIVLRSTDKGFFEEFTQDNPSLRSTDNLTILYSDKLYKKHNSLELSTCQLYKGKKLINVFYLKNLFEQLDVIKALTYEVSLQNTDTLLLDSINLSERIFSYRSGNNLYTYDYLLNKIVHSSISEMLSGTGKLTTVKPENISKGWLMNIAHLDTSVYKGVYPIFRALGQDKIRYEAVYSKNDTLYTLASFKYPEFSGKDTIISGYYYIFKYHNNKLKEIYYIDDSSLKGGKYYLDNTMPFYVDSGTYFLPVYVDSLEPDIRMFGVWKTNKSDHQLAFEKLDDRDVPSFFDQYKELYNGNSAVIADDVYFYNAYPFILNFKNNMSFDLGAALEEVERKKLFGSKQKASFYLKDVVITGKLLKLLYFVGQKPKTTYYDTTNGKILAVKDIPVSKDFYLPSLVFLDGSTIFVFSQTRKKGFLIK